MDGTDCGDRCDARSEPAAHRRDLSRTIGPHLRNKDFRAGRECLVHRSRQSRFVVETLWTGDDDLGSRNQVREISLCRGLSVRPRDADNERLDGVEPRSCRSHVATRDGRLNRTIGEQRQLHQDGNANGAHDDRRDRSADSACGRDDSNNHAGERRFDRDDRAQASSPCQGATASAQPQTEWTESDDHCRGESGCHRKGARYHPAERDRRDRDVERPACPPAPDESDHRADQVVLTLCDPHPADGRGDRRCGAEGDDHRVERDHRCSFTTAS